MTLTKETMLTKNNISYPPTLDADLFRMDQRQLEDYFGAVLLGHYFEAHESIAFLPWTAALDRERNFGSGMGHLFAYAGNPKMIGTFYDNAELPQPYETYIDPEFRTRLMNVLVGLLGDATSGKDILARYGHTPDHPWIARNGKPVQEQYLESARRNIIQGCIDVVSSILWKDGENSMGSQSEAAMVALFEENDGETTIGALTERLDEEVEIAIHPDHLPLLQLIKRLVEQPGFDGKYEFGNIIASYFSLLE